MESRSARHRPSGPVSSFAFSFSFSLSLSLSLSRLSLTPSYFFPSTPFFLSFCLSSLCLMHATSLFQFLSLTRSVKREIPTYFKTWSSVSYQVLRCPKHVRLRAYVFWKIERIEPIDDADQQTAVMLTLGKVNWSCSCSVSCLEALRARPMTPPFLLAIVSPSSSFRPLFSILILHWYNVQCTYTSIAPIFFRDLFIGSSFSLLGHGTVT